MSRSRSVNSAPGTKSNSQGKQLKSWPSQNSAKAVSSMPGIAEIYPQSDGEIQSQHVGAILQDKKQETELQDRFRSFGKPRKTQQSSCADGPTRTRVTEDILQETKQEQTQTLHRIYPERAERVFRSQQQAKWTLETISGDRNFCLDVSVKESLREYGAASIHRGQDGEEEYTPMTKPLQEHCS